MHPYLVSCNIRNRVKVYIAVFSALIFLLLEELGVVEKLINVQDNSQVLSDLSRFSLLSIVITPILIYKFMFMLFDKWIWKLPFVSKMTGVPNLSGSYEGTLTSSYNQETLIKMELEINQTFTNICFVSKFGDSQSNSSLARIHQVDDNFIDFDFIYENQSDDFHVESGRHLGVNQFTLHRKNQKLDGRYFNDRGTRPNKGRIELRVKD